MLAVPELITFSWIYGLERLRVDIKFMQNVETSAYFRLTWKIVSPLLMFTILVYHIVSFQPISYNGQEYPTNVIGKFDVFETLAIVLSFWTFFLVIGWCIFCCGIIQLPFWMLVALIHQWKPKNILKASLDVKMNYLSF